MTIPASDTSSNLPRGLRATIRDFVLAFAPVLAASALAQIATMPNLVWHATLVKPSFNPPNWLFGPVWTLLYLMMAYAFFRVLRAPDSEARTKAATWFLIQMALNATWSWTFFGFHSPFGGVVVILALLAAIVMTMRHFLRVDSKAGILLLPYAAWVSFATVLNIAIWQLN